MSQRAATITSLPVAFEVVKAMQADGLDWGEGYRPLGRQALQEIIEDQMAAAIDRHLDQIDADDAADRRNGCYRRHLLTELGDIELQVPRTRRYSPVEVLRAYARRTREIDRVILAGFVLGLSTRKVGETLLALLGRSVSASTVSQVAKTLDAAVAAFHRRPLQNRYKALMLDGVVLARKTGAGALRRPVLVALGLRQDGKKEIIDFRLAASESAAEWEKSRAHRRRARHDLRRRGFRPACGFAYRIAQRPRSALLGAQDKKCAQQSPQSRSTQGQTGSAQDHECGESLGRPICRASVCGAFPGAISGRRCLLAQRSRRAAHMFPLQNRSRAACRADHQRRRAALSRS
jgi:hypothetical protein